MADTTYIVLRLIRDDGWQRIEGTFAATTPQGAIRQAYEANSMDMGNPVSPTSTELTREGTYVAVPARSWKPVQVEAVQTTVLKLT